MEHPRNEKGHIYKKGKQLLPFLFSLPIQEGEKIWISLYFFLKKFIVEKTYKIYCLKHF